MDFLLRFSLAAGAFFITLGMVLNIYQSWKEGDYGRMLFDGQGIAGVVFYWTAGLAIFAVSGFKELKKELFREGLSIPTRRSCAPRAKTICEAIP